MNSVNFSASFKNFYVKSLVDIELEAGEWNDEVIESKDWVSHTSGDVCSSLVSG